jgi:hypothetical protein
MRDRERCGVNLADERAYPRTVGGGIARAAKPGA